MEHTVSLSQVLGFTRQESFEYLLVAYLSKEVSGSILNEKGQFSDAYGVSIARSALPHITVLNFLAKEQMEETLIKRMQRITGITQSFNVMLNNYSGFPSSQTIYVRIQCHEPFKQLAASLKAIDEYVRSNGFPQVGLNNRPHIAIAKGLQPEVYEKALKDYSQRAFNASFVIDELILLKRMNQYDTCKQVAVFKLAASYSA